MKYFLGIIGAFLIAITINSQLPWPDLLLAGLFLGSSLCAGSLALIVYPLLEYLLADADQRHAAHMAEEIFRKRQEMQLRLTELGKRKS